MGLEVVSHIFDAATDTHCFVLKDEPREVRISYFFIFSR